MIYDIAIAGGGLAGLTAATLLGRQGYRVILFEKKEYPFHRVCGEYISNEVLPFLKEHDLYPHQLAPAAVSQFFLTDTGGQSLRMPLDLGGFGISRYAFDHFLVQKASEAGVEVQQNSRLDDISYAEDLFRLRHEGGGEEVTARVVIGAYGKQARLDRQLDRDFGDEENDYIGVKYHIRGDFAIDEVALHNFSGGYCGLSAIEDGRFNLCYLARRSDLRAFGTTENLEREVLRKNPYLDDIFTTADFLFDKPVVISNFGFYPRTAVQNHVLMAGDAAGLITPLCGNGMAMAIHAAKLTADAITMAMAPGGVPDRQLLEDTYGKSWNSAFRRRLAVGRRVQQLFGHSLVSSVAVRIAGTFRPLARSLMKRTHGQPFQ
ncbi:MAG: NAD(P)/FAD-dependent oxidoreductase [Cyclobacteriaceae bacterium]